MCGLRPRSLTNRIRRPRQQDKGNNPTSDYLRHRLSRVAPDSRGRTQLHQPPELLKGVLHCFYHDIYGLRPMSRGLRNEDIWRKWLRAATVPVDALAVHLRLRFLAEDVFIEVVHELAEQVQLGSAFVSTAQPSPLISVTRTLTATTITRKTTTTTVTAAVSSP